MLPTEQNRVGRRPTAPSPAPPQLAGPVTLASSYAACQALHRTHGTTYYWATKALPRGRQRHVHAVQVVVGACVHGGQLVICLHLYLTGGTEYGAGRISPIHRQFVDARRIRTAHGHVLRSTKTTAHTRPLVTDARPRGGARREQVHAAVVAIQ